MRQLKKEICTIPNDVAAVQEMFDRSSQELRQTTLLMLLNQESGRHRMTHQPLTPDLRRRLTRLVVTVKQTDANLAFLEPITFESDFNSAGLRSKQEIAEINQSFSQVRLIPEVRLAPDGRSIEVVESLYIDPEIRLGNLHEHQWRVCGTDSTLLEAQAVLGLISIVKNGTLDLLLRCDCGVWFIASRTDHKFCSPTCRQRNHAAKPDFNEKRRVYYRNAKDRQTAKLKKEAGNNAKKAK